MRPFVFLGRISLGFYLFHQPLMIRFSNLGGFDFTNYALLDADIIAIFGLTILAAICFHILVEVPSRKLIRSLYS